MIACHVGRNPLEYVGYGCYCGIGGKGVPKDQTDRYKVRFFFCFFFSLPGYDMLEPQSATSSGMIGCYLAGLIFEIKITPSNDGPMQNGRNEDLDVESV